MQRCVALLNEEGPEPYRHLMERISNYKREHRNTGGTPVARLHRPEENAGPDVVHLAMIKVLVHLLGVELDLNYTDDELANTNDREIRALRQAAGLLFVDGEIPPDVYGHIINRVRKAGGALPGVPPEELAGDDDEEDDDEDDDEDDVPPTEH
jgi:hypothetical protein